jgi:hypothetical protein
LTLKLSSKMSPEIRILLFTIIEEEIIADSININLKNCFNNKVFNIFDSQSRFEIYLFDLL